MKTKLHISDKNGKTLIKIKDDRVLVARYVGMSQQTKDTIIEFYTSFTGEDPYRIRNFLDYKNEEFEFCS